MNDKYRVPCKQLTEISNEHSFEITNQNNPESLRIIFS